MSKLFNSTTGYINLDKSASHIIGPYKTNLEDYVLKEDMELYKIRTTGSDKIYAIITQEKEKALQNFNIPQDKQGNKDFIINAINNASFRDIFYSRLEFMAPELRNDIDVMLAIVNKHESLSTLELFWKQYVPTILKQNKNFVLGLIKHNGQMFKILYKTASQFIKDKDVVAMAINQDFSNSKYIYVDLLQNKEVCIAMVSQKGLALNKIDYYDYDVGLAAVKQNGLALYYVPMPDRQTPEMSLEALKNNINAWKYVPQILKRQKGFVLQVIDTLGYEILPLLSYTALKQNNAAENKNWNDDLEIGLYTLSKSSNAYNFLSKELQTNPQILNAYEKAKAKEEESV